MPIDRKRYTVEHNSTSGEFKVGVEGLDEKVIGSGNNSAAVAHPVVVITVNQAPGESDAAFLTRAPVDLQSKLQIGEALLAAIESLGGL